MQSTARYWMNSRSHAHKRNAGLGLELGSGCSLMQLVAWGKPQATDVRAGGGSQAPWPTSDGRVEVARRSGQRAVDEVWPVSLQTSGRGEDAICPG
jgi:hypothetical protein